MTLKTAALAQIGLAANTFACSSVAGEGVGDDRFSWVSGLSSFKISADMLRYERVRRRHTMGFAARNGIEVSFSVVKCHLHMQKLKYTEGAHLSTGSLDP